MTVKTARLVLRCLPPHRKESPDREQRAALKLIAKSQDALEALDHQTEADALVAEKIHVNVPTDLTTTVQQLSEKLRLPARRSHFSVREPAFLALVLAFVAMVSVGIWLMLAQSDQFPGMDEAKALANKGDASQQVEFEPLDARVGGLGDWFLIQGFDGFVIPQAFTDFSVVGVRVFDFEGVPVAMAAVPENRAFFYVFPSQKLGIKPGESGTWRILEYEHAGTKRVLGISQSGEFCFMVTFAGSHENMEKFIRNAENR